MKIRTSLRTALANEMLAAITTGTLGSPKLEIYSGSMPAAIGDAISGTLLAEFTLTNTFGTVSDGVITLDPIDPDTDPAATGTAGFGRLLDRDGNEVLYMTVSIVGSGGEIQLSSLDIAPGEPVSISSGVIRAGA